MYKNTISKIANSLKKLAEAQQFKVVLTNIEWDTDEENPKELKLPSKVSLNISATTEDDAIEKSLETVSDYYGYLVFDANTKVTPTSNKASTYTAAKKREIYTTTFCNQGHDLATGRPINHECYILPPAALKAEKAGDYELAQEIMDKYRGKLRSVTPRKVDV